MIELLFYVKVCQNLILTLTGSLMPSAFEFEEEARKISKLQEENTKYKNMVGMTSVIFIFHIIRLHNIC